MYSFNILCLQVSRPWIVILENQNQIDFQESQTRSMVLELDTVNSNRTIYALKMSSDSNTTVPFTLSYTMDPLDRTIGIMYALVLLCALYVLIIFEVSYFLIQIIKESSRQARPDHTTA